VQREREKEGERVGQGERKGRAERAQRVRGMQERREEDVARHQQAVCRHGARVINSTTHRREAVFAEAERSRRDSEKIRGILLLMYIRYERDVKPHARGAAADAHYY